MASAKISSFSTSPLHAYRHKSLSKLKSLTVKQYSNISNAIKQALRATEYKRQSLKNLTCSSLGRSDTLDSHSSTRWTRPDFTSFRVYHCNKSGIETTRLWHKNIPDLYKNCSTNFSYMSRTVSVNCALMISRMLSLNLQRENSINTLSSFLIYIYSFKSKIFSEGF